MSDQTREHPPWPPVQRRLMGMLFATPLYGPTLLHRKPARLSALPPDPWPGDPGRAAAMIKGVYAFAGATVRPEGSPWDESATDPAWRDAMHGFCWLRDLRALGGDEARRAARKLTAEWLARHQRWSTAAWRADVTGGRLAAWFSHFELLFSSAPDPFRSQLLASMARQARHLGRTAGREVDGMARLEAIKGLMLAGICIPGELPLLARAIRLLEIELPRQIAADGGHAERSPEVQLHLVRSLVDMRAALSAGRQPPVPALSDAIERAAPMLRFFRHGDGGFALFNDTAEGDPTAIDFALAQANIRKRTPPRAAETGFERLSAGKLLVIADAGVPSRPGWDSHNHAGTLGFEVSFARERLIVNCGPAATVGAEWRDAARATAAHATLTVEDTNSSAAGTETVSRLSRVHVERQESDGNIWLSASHNGYARPFGLIHHRRLFMAGSGDELRGEDRLSALDSAAPSGDPANRAFAVRFHLHPAVRASLVQNGAAVLLRLSGGTGWRLRASGARLDLAESIYFGRGGAKRTQQVVLSGRTDGDGATVKWALRREGGKS